MKRLIQLSLISLSVLSVTAYAQAPKNLDFQKQTVERYVASGQYNYDFRQVANKAKAYLLMRIAENAASKPQKKLAIVLDIDETSLSNYKYLVADGFGYTNRLGAQMLNAADDPALKPTLRLYNFAKAHDIAVFFITGRTENFRAVTIKNLEFAGYKNWNALYLKPNNYAQKSVIPYKTEMRQKIEAQGYDIVESMGDQYSDLAGGNADRDFKVPDPFYYIP